LLAGEDGDRDGTLLAIAADLGYHMAGGHLGVIAAGAGAEEVLRELARRLDRRLLSLPQGGGPVLRRTLHAYFAAERNASSAAAALGVARKTIASRLSTIETRLGYPLRTCPPELEVALRLDELTAYAGGEDSGRERDFTHAKMGRTPVKSPASTQVRER
jgi:hypothetical protein